MTNPIRILEGNAKPHEAFWRFVNSEESQSGETELEFYGYISEYSWFEDDVTPKQFKKDLTEKGNGGPVTIRLNSGGGDMIAASVIRAMLLDYPGKITVKIDGLAASAAVLVALAGDRIMMQESAYLMIHDPMIGFMFAYLNIEDMEQYLAELKTLKNGIVDAYETKTGMKREKLAKMMTNETWMTAREAKNYGFIDEVITQGEKKIENRQMQNVGYLNAIYRNIPETLLSLLQERDETIEPQPEDEEVRKLRAECQLYSTKGK